MTSSLVGSEMCIRDRFFLMSVLLDLRKRHTQHTASLAVSLSDTVHAVSYTHLTLPTICSV
eukprot:7704370-Prorocentrum_lima.AAC.1